MRLVSWNCRGLGSPSTIPQLRESLRLYKPELVFLCETKRSKGFVGTVCKKLGWGDRWYEVDPEGRSGGLLVGWGHDVIVHQILGCSYSVEVEFETPETKGKIWAIFIYASIKEKLRSEQWRELLQKKKKWGENWIMGGGISMILETQKRSEGGGLELQLAVRSLMSL